MADPQPIRSPRPVPSGGARTAERRQHARRRADRRAREEAALLARLLDVLATDASAEARLAGLLDLLAGRVGARRAAVLTVGADRRVVVGVRRGEDRAAAAALATWLDQEARRPRADRVATGRAPITFATGTDVPPEEVPLDGARIGGVGPPELRFGLLAVPSAGRVVLGFEMTDSEGVQALADRLSPTLARHAAVALALVTQQLAVENELLSLRAGEAERERFVSTVAHDLRTPLTGLKGYLDLILEGKVEDPAVEREFLERSRRIVESMGELVDDLLELSRLDSGNLGLEIAPFSIADVGSRAIAALAPLALDRGIELDCALPPRIRAATGDRRHAERILVNLAGNALKFTSPGGRVELAGRFEGAVAVIVVRDDGAGISAVDRDRVFERFYRTAGHESIAGTGLGLPIARDLARAMGGELGLVSVPGSGTSFVLVLPGPAAVAPEALVAALGRALADEQVRLEERAVLRALRAGARSGRQTSDGAGREQRGIRLRAIDGALAGTPLAGTAPARTPPAGTSPAEVELAERADEENRPRPA